jgi:hypothetical protein
MAGVKSKKSQEKYLHVSIFRGGALVGSCSRPFSKRRPVTAGKGRSCEIRSVIWPLWDDLEVILATKSGLLLNPQIPWDGVLQSDSTVHVLGTSTKRNSSFPITSTTSASLRYEDLSVAIRVGPKIRFSDIPVKRHSGYMASPLTFIADSAQEWTAIGIAAAASAVIFLFALSTLVKRPYDHYAHALELPAERLLPFISHRFLTEAPNILQDGLDRLDLIRSVWVFYSDLASVVGFGLPPAKVGPLFPSTIGLYEKLRNEQEEILDTASVRQQAQVDKLESSRSILSVPMVTGESLDGRVGRVFDKIEVLMNSSDALADRRVVVAAQFMNDIGYTFDARKGTSATSDNFKKISESFQGIQSDDKEQFAQAKAAGAKAALLQMDIFGSDRLQFGLSNCCYPVVGAPLVQDGLVWLAPDFTKHGNGDLSFLKASTWGTPVREVPKIIEPLAGHIEPAEVERTVAAGRYQLRLCYEIALRRNQATKGSMEWRMRIDSRGLVSMVDLLTNSLKDDEFVRCIHDRIATWKFPKPRGGSVEVRYPFEFSRDKG